MSECHICGRTLGSGRIAKLDIHLCHAREAHQTVITQRDRARKALEAILQDTSASEGVRAAARTGLGLLQEPPAVRFDPHPTGASPDRLMNAIRAAGHTVIVPWMPVQK